MLLTVSVSFVSCVAGERKKHLAHIMKDIRLHQICASDLMKVVVPADVVATDTVMAALAYQLDPGSVDPATLPVGRQRRSPEILLSSVEYSPPPALNEDDN